MIDKCIPGKRLRNWHRHDRDAGGRTSLKAYVRWLAMGPSNPAEIVVATAWLKGKGVRL